MSNDIDHVLFTAEQLSERVAQLGAQITADYADNDVPPLVICILRGAATFASDLVRAIDLPIEIDYMAISSYGAATRSSGILRIVKDLDTEIKDRDVIVIEDVLDSGLTLRYLSANLQARGVRIRGALNTPEQCAAALLDAWRTRGGAGRTQAGK